MGRDKTCRPKGGWKGPKLLYLTRCSTDSLWIMGRDGSKIGMIRNHREKQVIKVDMVTNIFASGLFLKIDLGM